MTPQILENWHHPYYRELLEAHGLTKAMDLYKWEIMADDRDKMLPVIDELADRLEPEHGIRLRRMRRRNFEMEIRRFMDVYNEAWSHNWGFVPLTDAELKHMAKELKPILDEDFACVAETADGEVAGVSLSLPDYNKVLAELNGRLLPLGWVKALTTQRERSTRRGCSRSASSPLTSTPVWPRRSTGTCGTRSSAASSRVSRRGGSSKSTRR